MVEVIYSKGSRFFLLVDGEHRIEDVLPPAETSPGYFENRVERYRGIVDRNIEAHGVFDGQWRVENLLEMTDADMARITEDLIDCGGDPDQLPQAAKDKVEVRKALRARLAELE